MPTANQFRVITGLARGIKVANEFDPAMILMSLRREAGVKANSAVFAHIAQQPEKIALAAADLDDVFAAQTILFDEPRRQSARIFFETGRKMQRVLIVGSVLHKTLRESEIVHQAAFRAESQAQLAAWRCDRCFPCLPHQIAVHRHQRPLKENQNIRRCAYWATRGRDLVHSVTIFQCAVISVQYSVLSKINLVHELYSWTQWLSLI
jgi:hypothetical protein